MRKKILYVVTQGEWGGAQRYVFDLATKLGEDFEVCVAVGEADGRNDLQDKLNQESRIKNYGASEVKVLQLKYLMRKISPIQDVLAIFELRKLYKDLQPDIIHLNSSKAGILGSLAATSYKLQATSSIVYTVHGWVFNEPLSFLRKTIYFYLEKWTACCKNKFIMLSEKEAKQGEELLGIQSEKLAIIPHGIDLPEHIFTKEQARAELVKKTSLPVNNQTTWVGTIANYYPAKGLDILLHSIKINKEVFKDVVFLLIGEGEERKKLSEIIKENNLTNVHLVGTVDNASQYLPAFDLFVLPSRKEGLPYALLEAKSYQVPIIATDVGGVAKIVDKKTGLLVKSENPLELSNAIRDALQNLGQFNPEQTGSLAEEINRTTSLYHSLLPARQT